MSAPDRERGAERAADEAASRRSDPPTAGILRLAAPLVVSFVARASFAWVDTIFAAELDREAGAGDFARAAITLTLPFEFAMIACWVGTSSGLTARLSAAMGAREGARVEQLQRASMRVIQVLSVLFVALAGLLWLFPERIATPGAVEHFRVYATVTIAGAGVVGFWSVLPDSVVKAHHDMRSTMWAGLISGGTNLVLNVVYMKLLGWGMFGIAFSTVCGRVAALVYASHRAAVHERRRRAAGRDTRPGTWERPIRAIGVIAVPASITFLLMSVETQVVNAILSAGPDPSSALAAWGLFDQTTRFVAMPVIACGVAMLPLAARLWGRGDVAAIRREVRTALFAALAFGVVVALPLGLLAGPWIARRLSTAPEAVAWSIAGMRWLPLAVLATSPIFLLRSTFEGLQMPRPALVVSLVRTLGLVVPLVLFGTHVAPALGHAPVEGAYAGFTVGVALASALMALWLRRTLRACDGQG